MKNKKLTYVLLPLVILIWGTIIWKMMHREASTTVLSKTTIVSGAKNSSIESVDTIQLSFSYSDPFLKDQHFDEEAEEKTPEVPAQILYNRVIAWPMVSYGGGVGKHGNEIKLGLLQVNGHDYLVHRDDVISSIEVKHVWMDSVSLEYENEIRNFKRQGL